MDHVELAIECTGNLSGDDLFGWQVKTRGRKGLDQAADVLEAQGHHHIHVVGETRLAVKDGGHAAAHHVTQPEPVQRPQKQQREFSFGHD